MQPHKRQRDANVGCLLVTVRLQQCSFHTPDCCLHPPCTANAHRDKEEGKRKKLKKRATQGERACVDEGRADGVAGGRSDMQCLADGMQVVV